MRVHGAGHLLTLNTGDFPATRAFLPCTRKPSRPRSSAEPRSRAGARHLVHVLRLIEGRATVTCPRLLYQPELLEDGDVEIDKRVT